MIVLAGGDVVLPDRVLPAASLVIDRSRIAAVEAVESLHIAGASTIDVSHCVVVPGFIDVHVHGVEGFDTLDAGDPIREIAARLPRYGVTAFCPTTVACGPSDLARVAAGVMRAQASPAPGGARVLPAHLESNFINPEYRGAQPAACLRLPPHAGGAAGRAAGGREREDGHEFSADDVLAAVAESHGAIGIVTMAPELPGGLDLVRELAARGHRVSIGHSGATFEEALAAIEAGACQATHLFNRMAPLAHRAPGLAGAVLSRSDVAAELICDGYHVHPAVCRLALTAKGADRLLAITDGTAGAGLSVGAETRIGGQSIRVTESAAILRDGTLAGSTLTMDRAFATIVTRIGATLVEAAAMCSGTPAREMGLQGLGVLGRDRAADLVVLDRAFRVVRTFVAGNEVYCASHVRPATPF